MIHPRLQMQDAGFADLYRDYSPFVHRLALRMLGDAHEAEDAVHDIFIRIHDSLPSFRGASTPKTWIYRIAMNHCLNRLRRSRTLRFLSWSSFRRPPEPTTSDPPRETALLDRLSPKLRAAVVLKDVEGLSYDEIAAALGIAAGTAMSRVARGREELRRFFSESMEENK